MKRISIDENFIKLSNLGFYRRVYTESEDEEGHNPDMSLLSIAARRTENSLELKKTKEQQLNDLKKKKILNRSGAIKLLPQSLHKYIDYISSCYKKPSSNELVRNLGLGAFLSFVTSQNSGRTTFNYCLVGNLLMVSALLTRGMPKKANKPGMARSKPATWSSNSFKTAIAITLFSSLLVASIVAFLTSLVPMSVDLKTKLILCLSLMFTSFSTSHFEVYEEKSKNGWRWTKAMEGTLPEDVEAKLAEQVFSSNKEMVDLYDYAYDPEIDDYPPKPKFVDDLQEKTISGGSGELDEIVELETYEKWKIQRKEARKPPVEEAPPETPWIGGKAGMYVKNIPTWLESAYKKNVLRANKWRDLKAKYVKDFTEFEPLEGPIGFRDKRPGWLDLFGTGVWEEQTTASRRAARSYGTYRKTMYKLDKKVVLLPCDGADKEKERPKDSSD